MCVRSGQERILVVKNERSTRMMFSTSKNLTKIPVVPGYDDPRPCPSPSDRCTSCGDVDTFGGTMSCPSCSKSFCPDNPRNPVVGNVLSFHKHRVCSLVWLLRTPRSDRTGPPLKGGREARDKQGSLNRPFSCAAMFVDVSGARYLRVTFATVMRM